MTTEQGVSPLTAQRGGRDVVLNYGSVAGEISACVRYVGIVDRADLRVVELSGPATAFAAVGTRLAGGALDVGGIMRVAEWLAWERLIGAPLIQGYGMTETIGPPLMSALDGSARRDAVGRPTMGYAVRLVDPDGTPVEMGQAGELLVSGTPGLSLMAGYLNDEGATRSTVDRGWLRTGDVLRVEPDGQLAFVDRSKDMIKRAGENVAAGEVESVLRDHPQVVDVAVVGAPDAMRDEQIVAFVVVDGAMTPEDLIAWSAERLAKFRVPSVVRFLPGVPRTSVGKVQKHLLREEWAAGASVDESPDPHGEPA
jgi:crotonobetaine/carnitine-CoA ligase